MIHIFLAAVFNHIFVHLQALLREKYSDMRILLTTHPMFIYSIHLVFTNELSLNKLERLNTFQPTTNMERNIYPSHMKELFIG